GALYVLCRGLALSVVAALLAVAMLAAAPSFWAEANVQRVYSLNALFVVLATAAAWRWCVRGNLGSLAAGMFLCGLGASNHTFMAVHAAALLVFALIVEPSLFRRPSAVAAVLASFVTGLAPY